MVICCPDHSGGTMDRPTDDRGAHSAPFTGLGSRRAVPRTLQVHSAQPNLAPSPARCSCRRGRAFLPAPRIRLARDPNRCQRRSRRRSHPRCFHHYAATGKKLVLRNGPLILRKGAEITLVPVAEFVLGKRRILEIYLNVVEWGPGIYGAESACRYYDETAARNIDRQQAARLAAILPAPLRRRPERMNSYSAIILERMSQMGW